MKKTAILSLLSLLFLIVSCKKTTQEESNITAYGDYLSLYPEGLISVTPNLEFYLNKTPDIVQISSDAITISPTIEGEVSLNDNILSFIPKNHLEHNKDYFVTLHLSKLYNEIDDNLKDFTVKLKTKDLQFGLNISSPSIKNKDVYYLEGTLNASDVFETTKLPEVLKAEYAGQPVKITFDTQEGYASKVSFKIDDIKRFPDDKTLKVSWNGSPIKSSSKGSRELNIIGKSNFKVLSVDVINDSKQSIEINFSDPIKSGQDIKALVQFLNTQKQNFTYKINTNVVSIFPSKSFTDKVDIEIFKAIKNSDGYNLKENYSKTLFFKQQKPKVSFIKSGTILPDSDNLKLNFTAVNLRAVDIIVYKIYKDNVLQFLQTNNLNTKSNLRYVGRPEVRHTLNLSDKGLSLGKENAFAVDLAEIIPVENGAMYRVELSYNQFYSNYVCDGKEPTNTITYGKKEVNDKAYDAAMNRGYYYDDYYEDDYDNSYNWNERENPCKASYYHNKAVSTNILASNLGVTLKKGNNNTALVAVTDIVNAVPVKGARVELFNLQKQSIQFTQTDGEGIAKFSDMTSAYFAVVSKGTSTTYVKLNDGNALSMSKFDVSGTKLQKGIKGYIYGERGVWRPGDQLFLSFVLNDKANPIPEKHPIKFELSNPQGKIVDRKVLYKNTDNVYAYTPKTNQDAITGNWGVKVKVGGATFWKRLKIETIKPNRLKININTNSNLIKANSLIKGDVEVKWLHGAIARGLKIDIEGKFRQTKTTFDNFSNYNFDDVTRKFGTESFSVFEGNLTNEGTTNFSVKPNLEHKAPGLLKASFITKVYENGGDFSTDVFTQNVSPYTSYAGLISAEEQQSRNYLFTDEDYTFNIASVNQNGQGIANNLEVRVYKMSWRWWWSSRDNGLSNYDGSRYHEPYKTLQASTSSNGKGAFNLKIGKNDWGRYLVKVKDKTSGHITSSVVYFDWPSWYGRKRGSQDKTNATMLTFTTDKESYKVDETATVKFPSSEGGRAFLTIENGTEVLDHFWVETQDKQTTFSFPVKATYTPNVFVNISLLQQHSQTINDLPIRMYGSVPMLVYDPATKLVPELEIAEELKPETTTTLTVSEKNSNSMTYTIAIVDDGLLDLTRFKTPNPWDTFFARQSLGVKTWDIFDDVIGAYGGEVNQILSIGGDEAEAGSKNKKANRFKPMVTYLGPFKLNSGETKTHEITIPKYVGSVRTMVVASDTYNDAYGSVEKTSLVRKPVMILASLPRKITPKETVTLPVTVFAMKPNIKNVNVTVQPNESYSIIGNNTQQIAFSQPDEKMAYFTLKVNDFKGIGNIHIEATSGSEKASYDVEIDVLNPNPITTEVKDIVLKSGEQSNMPFTAFGTAGTNVATIELSTLPSMNFTERLGYLIRYPHGCIEQTTSSGFPQLFLPDIFELSQDKTDDIDRNIKATIRRLSAFQLANGGLSYWQGGSHTSSWGTSYAGHFMIEAAKKGYVLPIGFKSKWVAYQKDASRRWRHHTQYNDNDLAQAYRLYTLCLAGSPDLASMNRLRETNGIRNAAKNRLAAAYALLGKQSIATSILNNLKPETDNNRYYYYNYGSVTRNKAMELETYTLLNDDITSIRLAKHIAEQLSSSTWMSTQTTAYSLLAMSKFASKSGDNTGIKAAYSLDTSHNDISSSKSLFTDDIVINRKENILKVSNKSSGVLYVRLLNKGILPVGEEKVYEKNLNVSVVYKNKDGASISINELQQGTNFIAEVSVRNSSTETIENVALTQFLPSGWEVINTRFTDFGNNTESSEVDYTDIRDASISHYFTLKKYATKTFRIQLNASYLGDYYLPGIIAEAMYDNNYSTHTKGRWVKVVK